jgi:TPP-dependent 2-oxoacid decarboxylase
MSYKPIKIVNQLFWGMYNHSKADSDQVLERETTNGVEHQFLNKTIDSDVIVKSIIITNVTNNDTQVSLYFKDSSTPVQSIDAVSYFLKDLPLLANETFIIDVTQVLEPGDMIIAETGDIQHKVTIHISGVEVDQ